MHAPILPLLRQSKAWWVSLFYVFRVAGSWTLIVWLAALLHRRGLPLEEAGLAVGMVTACEIPSTLLSGHFVMWLGSRERLLWIAAPLSVAAVFGLMLGPLAWWPLFSVIFGLCIGTIFTLGMTLIVENSPDSATTVALSGMSQGMGFILGGLLAWAASGIIDLPHPHLSMAIIYTLFAIASLTTGLKGMQHGLCSVDHHSK